MPPVDLTSTWIPLSLLAVLSTYMYVLFRRERQMSHAFEAEGGEATTTTVIPASATMAGEAAAAVEGEGEHTSEESEAKAEAPAAAPAQASVAAPAAAPVAEAPAKPKKRRILWNTAYLWLPFVAGFGWQAYLDFIKLWLEKTTG